MITLASLFDGIGGALLCAERCGAAPIWASEIEPFPIKVTKYHFPNVKHYGDITKINGAAVEPVDIIVGGSPCQDLSVAGLRKGMKHSDFGDEEATRSGLFMEQIRIIKEMRDATGTNQPRFMVWENVPGAFSSANGEDFRAVLEETARIADPTISIPRPQDGWRNSGSILGDGFSISWRTVDAQYWGVAQRRRRIYLVADFGGQSAPEILFEQPCGDRHIAESISERQGTAGTVEGGTGTAGFGETGIGWWTDGIQTLRAEGENRPSRPSNVVCYQINAMAALRPAVATFRKSARAQSEDGYETWVEDDKTNTVNTFDVGDVRTTEAVVFENHSRGPCAVYSMQRSDEYVAADVTSTESARQYKSATDLVTHTNAVRRLTPLECERLQGYPDNYTNIPGASDSARYKALGNSFAIPNALFAIKGCVEKLKVKE